MAGKSPSKSCAVTGANGYVGSQIAHYFKNINWDVLQLTGKRKTTAPQPDAIPFSLEEGIGNRPLENIDLLVHCAYDFRWTKWGDIHRVNVQGSVKLFDAAEAAGVKRLIVLSTMSAFKGARSLYGKAKLEIENEVIQRGGIVIRAGLVYGRNCGGMVGALNRLVSRASVVPLFGKGEQQQYLVHEKDLCALVSRCAIDTGVTFRKPITAARSKGIAFREILEAIAAAQGRRITFIPIPWQLPYAFLKLSESLGLDVGFRSDSLISLLNQNPSPDFEMTQKMDLSFREFDAHELFS
jgi:nucleoside-diphosphate-sugar epimerase